MEDSIDDDDVTICSEDFMMDDDDDCVTILRNFDEGQFGGVEVSNDGRQVNDTEKRNIENIPEQSTQIPNYDSIQSQIEPSIDNDVTFCESGFSIAKENLPKSNEVYLNDKINLIETELGPKLGNNLVSNDELNINHSNNELNQLTNSNYDTQNTILYTVHGFTQNNTHYSPSQNEILIPNKYLYRIKEDKNETRLVNNSNGTANALNSKVTNMNSLTKTNDNRSKDGRRNEIVSEDRMSESILANQDVGVFSQNMDTIFQENENDLTDITPKDINDGYMKNNFFERNSEYAQNVYDYFSEIHSINDITKENTIENEKSKDTLKSMQITKKKTQNNINNDNFDSNNEYLDTIQSVGTGRHIEQVIPNQNMENLTKNFEQNIDSSQQNTKQISPFEVIEEDTDTIEVIPYKVLEELNKIKMYLRRRDRRMSCDGYSTDSGYKSDSQLRSSNRSALQLSGISINQSAFCLLNHITQCALVGATREITGEMAQTLGQLVDRLHEEETYPPFLEELLDTVDILLRQVYEGQSCDDSELLKKDEFIQRIMLLNKSIHIQSHSIEKITSILTKFHENITDSSVTYELTNIDQVENVSYLFHILEMLLKKYIKNKGILSQGSQLSQDEDKILNKSSITDIWRKKWNPNFKDNSAGSREKRCVLKSCSEILNKVIVDCVNSYSLVAYSALRCFNSMQS
ncbi:unnamed protein product [Arctia plantaginis]|uniref:Uncharacterized protein n=1 Tax=Arctia plantaginis TaxID=874455 RepID=A0A8S1BEP5_ARCPL|nr:unnamed protein product [Arctia plantaginis]